MYQIKEQLHSSSYHSFLPKDGNVFLFARGGRFAALAAAAAHAANVAAGGLPAAGNAALQARLHVCHCEIFQFFA